MFKKIRRRKFPRLAQHCLLKYKIFGKNTVLTFARNINAGGMLFYSEAAPPVGTTVEIWLNFLFHPEVVKAKAEILRVKPLKKIGGYDVAAKFINLEEKDKYFINNTIMAIIDKELGKTRAKKSKVTAEDVCW